MGWNTGLEIIPNFSFLDFLLIDAFNFQLRQRINILIIIQSNVRKTRVNRSLPPVI